MAKRKGGQANGKGLVARRPLIVGAWLGIVVATLAATGAWAYVARGLGHRPSPGHVLESKTIEHCHGISVIEGDAVWMQCENLVRLDTATGTFESWPAEDVGNTADGLWRGFLPGERPVVVMGASLIRLKPNGAIERIARDLRFQRAVGLWSSADTLEIATPSGRSVDVRRYTENGEETRSFGWRVHPELGALEVVGARKATSEWHFIYAATPPDAPLFVGGEDQSLPVSVFEAEVHRRKDATYEYLDSPSWMFPADLTHHVEYRLSYIRLGKTGVADWDIGGPDFGSSDLMVTPEGLLPLVEVMGEEKAILRHGRRLHMTRDVNSHLLVAWDKDPLVAIASDWPARRTIVVPRGDGGLTFVSQAGHLARVNGALERTDRVFAFERLYKGLQRSSAWGPYFLLFTWPLAAACAVLIALLAHRRRVHAMGLAGALWFIGALVSFEQTSFFVFANSL